MLFDKQKKDTLSKQHKSIKKTVDPRIRKLVGLINGKENYYTTSSCSGRVVLLEKSMHDKQEAKWLYVTHEKAKRMQTGF